MTDVTPFERQRAMLRDLVALMEKRGRLEVEIEQNYRRDIAAGEEAFAARRKETVSRFETDRHAAEREYRTQEQQITGGFEGKYAKGERTFKSELATIAEKAEHNEKQTSKALQEALWLADTVYEATESQPIEQYLNSKKQADGGMEELETIRHKAADLMQRSRVRVPDDAPAHDESATDPQAGLLSRVVASQDYLDRMSALFLPKLFRGLWPLVWVVTLTALFVGAIWLAMPAWRQGKPLGVPLAISIGAAIALLALLYVVARVRMLSLYRPITSAKAEGQTLGAAAIKAAEEQREKARETLRIKRDQDIESAKTKYEPVLGEIEQRRSHYLQRINEKYPALMDKMKSQREEDLFNLREGQLQRMTTLEDNQKTDLAELQKAHDTRTQQRRERYEREWTALEDEWKSGMSAAYTTADELAARSASIFKNWDDAWWNDWQPPREFASIVRFGQMHVDLGQLPGGLPKDPRLALPGPKSFDLPAFLDFPEPVSMLLEAGEHGRDEAIATLQTVMFRMLTTLPPGKVRFTIVDPVGLGQNFAGFMHLADYEGSFVADKIWTEDRHIEQRLLDLTEHMENVIQKYLRNEYETIADYNVDAGEIAEPYRFLVIANFPVNFSETAARRLASIVNSGARCGVYTLITCDNRQQLPQGVSLADIVKGGVHLQWKDAPPAASGAGSRFVWNDDDLKRFPLALDPPPDENFVTEKLHIIGAAAKESTRVEVPFEAIAADPKQMWSKKTTSDISVALGRAGATKLQHLTLGVGTSQHALVAGKTGSGKSTLLHALITNLALWYPPDEIEFYLIDFKKGVEFKTYASHNLAHARAVAIESDREFGLSVLQRLDAELKHRGNIFRDLGVQDMGGYRRENPKTPLPRILLIVDEFQELFTEDDKLAQDASLLMDRLVRQGRAFGMHVLLGSQTLGGAYSLARSTIGQMGVRIALQCSEADSYLILSDDNAAARLLSRPGEAIYNDASGMVEGNNPFQICWLPDDKRDVYLDRVAEMVEKKHWKRPEPQIVFEGNIPADIARNHLLSNLLDRDSWPTSVRGVAAASAWLGEAIAIKDPTCATFRRQSGANLIIAGQRDDAAMAMLATSIVSLAAQHSPGEGQGSASFYIFDGTPVDAPGAGYLGQVASMLPHNVNVVQWRDVAAAINQVAEELQRRVDANIHDAPAIYLFINALQRYRMLRQEEDFGFSVSGDGDAPPRPEKQFSQIMREGPTHGIHLLAWCDTVNNLTRSLDRQGLREFEIRVLFQMGAADSSNLVDSPLAAKLGMHRALFFSEELGTLEKFRPYAQPDEHWLQEAVTKMRKRGVE